MSDQANSKVDVPASVVEDAPKVQSDVDSLFGGKPTEVKIRKAKRSKNISKGKCMILAMFNNTHISFTDMSINVISWSNAGKCNFRGSRKSTAYAAQVVVQDAGRTAMSHGMKEVTIFVKGPGMRCDSAIRTVQSLGLSIDEIGEVTATPHNGCRPRKPRRV
jgi:small subunit ribosomal protein S11